MKPKRKRGGRHERPPSSRADRWRGDQRRPAEGEAFLSGLNAVRESLQSPHVRIKNLWVDPGKLTKEGYALVKHHQEIAEDVGQKGCPYGELQQGLAVLVKLPRWPELEDLLDQPRDGAALFVVLDQVADPMNLGQMLRTCEGAGVTAIVLPDRRAVQLNQTVAQVSQGAFAWVPVVAVTNLRQALLHMKDSGLWVMGCEKSPEAKPWAALDWRGPLALVMGAEGKGLRELTRKTCDFLAYLPMQGRLDSLNVGAALSAFLYEALRQRAEPSARIP